MSNSVPPTTRPIMTATNACIRTGDRDAESSAKGLVVNTKLPLCQPVVPTVGGLAGGAAHGTVRGPAAAAFALIHTGRRDASAPLRLIFKWVGSGELGANHLGSWWLNCSAPSTYKARRIWDAFRQWASRAISEQPDANKLVLFKSPRKPRTVRICFSVRNAERAAGRDGWRCAFHGETGFSAWRRRA